MRYYKIDFSNNGKPVYLKSLNQPLTSLLADGVNTNQSALTVELDLPFNPFSTGDAANSFVKIWGVGLQDISNALDLNDKEIAVYGGMAKGLPLANPKQAGLLVQGKIFQAFGNWRGTEMSLDLVVGPSAGTISKPVNIAFVWPARQSLQVALANALNIAFPGIKQQINISASLVLSYPETGFYPSLVQFSQWLNQRTRAIVGGSYQGVQLAMEGTTITAWDGTVAEPDKSIVQIQPWDLIGQPTWRSPNEISFQTVMRADIGLGDTIGLPQTLISQSVSSLLRFQDRTSFSGKYLVLKGQHFGNYRQPDAASWNTTFWVTPTLNSTAPT